MGDNIVMNENSTGAGEDVREEDQSNDEHQEGELEQLQNEEGMIIHEEMQSEDSTHREGRRREYRRRMTLDPLVDLLADGVFPGVDNNLHNGFQGSNPDDQNRGSQEDNSPEGIHLDIDAAPENNRGNDNVAVADVNGRNNIPEVELLGELLGRYARSGGGDDSASSDGEDGNANESSNSDSNNNVEPPQPARNHSYLPTAQPLYPEEWIPAGNYRHRSRDSDASFLDELAGDDFETGSKNEDSETEASGHDRFSNRVTDTEMQSPSYYSIPEPSTRPHLHSNEHDITDEGTSSERADSVANLTTVAVMEIEDVVLFPGSIIPLRLRDRNWVNYLGELIDDARGLYGSHQGIVGKCPAGGMGEVRIVILPRVSVDTRRTRRRPREGGSGAGGRTGRWRVDLIRRGVTSTRSTRRIRRRSGRSESMENEALGDSSTIGNDDQGAIQHSASADTDEDSELHQRQNQSSESEGSQDDDFFHPAVAPTTPDDPRVSRIGTIGTITFTHEETASSADPSNSANDIANRSTQSPSPGDAQRSSSVWKGRGKELVLTVLGTCRVRVVRSVKDERSSQDRRIQVPLYEVEEIRDGSASLPPPWMMRPPGDVRGPTTMPATGESLATDEEEEDANANIDDTSNGEAYHAVYDNRYSSAIQNLSVRSSIPTIAYHAAWPWRLCQKICKIIQETEEFQGINNVLHLAAGLRFPDKEEHNDTIAGSVSSETTAALGQFQVVDPAAFANWISSNMPLSQNDRLDLLEIVCTVQQLKYILKRLEEKRQEIILRCKHCGAVISQMRNVFSVGGSEGTTGAYVNEHGIVHQTVTLRKVDNHSVVCIGRPETKDSWFPGYSWTIAYCSICSDHLGWKFRSVNGNDGSDPDRPRAFFGFSSITTDNHVTPRRVPFHTQRALAALLQQG